MSRHLRLMAAALPLALLAAPGWAQNLQAPAVPPPSPEEPAPSAPGEPAAENEVQFSSDTLEYDSEADIVTATGDVRMVRSGDRLRADKVTWNRRTGQVLAEGNIAVTNSEGDVAYGDRIDLTDSLKDGVVENMLVVLEQGGRLAARRGTRSASGVVTLESAAYTPCAVVDDEGCPKEPTWKIQAVRVVYDPAAKRVRYTGARIDLLGLVLPLPTFSHPVGGGSDSGLLAPDIRLDRVNGLTVAAPYYFRLAPNRDLTITPRVFTNALPMLQAGYRELGELGAFTVEAWGTYSRRSDDLNFTGSGDTENAFRGYLDANGGFQLDSNWSVTSSVRLASDRTFLRRYDISRDDRLRNLAEVRRIGRDSLFTVRSWAVQTLRVNDDQGMQPFALPEIDWRRRWDDVLGGRVQTQLNTLALTRAEGQDTQRAFASARWDMRRITRWGQEVTFTAFGRGDLYHTNDSALTVVPSYRGDDGFQARAIGAVAVDVAWPLIGGFGAGTQRITPRVQVVASPRIRNLDLPNEDARAVDLEDSNLFALNRFPGYDRFEDSTRFTYGVDYAVDLPGVAVAATVGQSYRLSEREGILPDGTGLSDKFSDIVGRTTVRFRDFVALTHRYRLDKGSLSFRRNEVDATVGSRQTYAQIGYLRLNRDITELAEDLADREELRIAGRVAFARRWSAFGSAVIDLTNRDEDPLSLADGFEPLRHRVGVLYADDCLELGVTWRRDYATTGDARRGNSFLLSLNLTNLGR